mgnify:CR=1 FL=1
MNKGKSKKKMNSYLKMVLIMLAGGDCWRNFFGLLHHTLGRIL